MTWWQIALIVWIVAGLFAGLAFGFLNLKEHKQKPHK
jgi:heme/copper-type cytochrome/quinol oxidase subunit 2